MCKYCDGPMSIQVSGGGRYATADVIGRHLVVYDGGGRTLRIKIKRCPMCGKQLEKGTRDA